MIYQFEYLFDRRLTGALRKICSVLVLSTCAASHNLLVAQTQSLAQMIHTSWTARDGAPQAITTLAQSTDGALWIGSEGGGITRFDGIAFTGFKASPGNPKLPSDIIESLYFSKDGALWVGMLDEGAARIANGHVTLYGKCDGAPLGTVSSIQQASDGTMWALSQGGRLVSFGHDGAWHKQAGPDGSSLPTVGKFIFDSSHNQWATQAGHLYIRPAGSAAFTQTTVQVKRTWGLAEAANGTVCLDDSVSYSEPPQTRCLDQSGRVVVQAEISGKWTGTIMTPDGAFWLAIWRNGLQRVQLADSSNQLALGPSPSRTEPEVFTEQDGLSSNHINALLRDSDGDVWAGGRRGLDRFKPSRIMRFLRADSDARWSICSNDYGELWIAGEDRLLSVGNDSIKEFTGVGVIYGLSCGRDHHVWLIDSRGIWDFYSGQMSRVAMMPGWPPNAVRQVVETRDHTLFVSVGSAIGGYWRRKAGRWSVIRASALPPTSPLFEFVDSKDEVWTGYRFGKIGLLRGERAQILSSGEPGLGGVSAFMESSRGLFAAGMNGLAVFRPDHFEMLTFQNQEAARGLISVVESTNGDVWLNGFRGIVRVPSNEIDSALADPRHKIESEAWAEGEFVGPVPLLEGTASAGIDGQGTLWFTTFQGPVSINPLNPIVPRSQPKLSIRTLSADGRPPDAQGRFVANPNAVAINYFGINLAAPEDVVYRYKLDGVNDTWQDAGHRSEAIYTRLPPGKYTFHVMASNGHDGWIAPACSAAFTVLPAFYQSSWFLGVCVIMGLLILWFLIVLRLQYVGAQIRGHAEQRADERVRIARDLHDTLLQGLHGLILRIHYSVKELDVQSQTRRQLDDALVLADRIMAEGRARVKQLRSDELTTTDLAKALEAVGEGLNYDRAAHFAVTSQGAVVVLQPPVHEQLFCIGREAVTNAFRHANASRIQVTISYERDAVQLNVRDNGCGFSYSEAASGSQSGHWGLPGMAERSKDVRAEFRCRSTLGGGTVIEVVVPAHVAYVGSARFAAFLRKQGFQRLRR
jgi:signal transduction histidine kinase/ligand-binding sensor domain-containing protein